MSKLPYRPVPLSEESGELPDIDILGIVSLRQVGNRHFVSEEATLPSGGEAYFFVLLWGLWGEFNSYLVTDGRDFWLCDMMEIDRRYDDAEPLPDPRAPVIDYGDPRAYWLIDPAEYPPLKCRGVEFCLTAGQRERIWEGIDGFLGTTRSA